MIKFENVVFGYGEEKNALNYVSFHISEGEHENMEDYIRPCLESLSPICVS